MRTSERSGRVKAHFLNVGELLSRRHPVMVLSTSGECLEDCTLGNMVLVVGKYPKGKIEPILVRCDVT